jgi:hypothetical protein
VVPNLTRKGVSAALIMSSVQAALRVAAPIEDDLAHLVQRLNALIYRGSRGRKYATFFFGRYTVAPDANRCVTAFRVLYFCASRFAPVNRRNVGRRKLLRENTANRKDRPDRSRVHRMRMYKCQRSHPAGLGPKLVRTLVHRRFCW